MKIAKSIVLSFALFGCISIKTAPKPYTNLTKASYGPLSDIKPYSCDPNIHPGSSIDQGLKEFNSFLFNGLEGAFVHDDSLYHFDLQDQFKLSADSDTPPVALISYTPKEVVFWFDYILVSIAEVKNAASKYCTVKMGKKMSRFIGASERCGDPQKLPIVVAGQQVIAHPSYVIAAFACL